MHSSSTTHTPTHTFQRARSKKGNCSAPPSTSRRTMIHSDPDRHQKRALMQCGGRSRLTTSRLGSCSHPASRPRTNPAFRATLSLARCTACLHMPPITSCVSNLACMRACERTSPPATPLIPAALITHPNSSMQRKAKMQMQSQPPANQKPL